MAQKADDLDVLPPKTAFQFQNAGVTKRGVEEISTESLMSQIKDNVESVVKFEALTHLRS